MQVISQVSGCCDRLVTSVKTTVTAARLLRLFSRVKVTPLSLCGSQTMGLPFRLELPQIRSD